MRRFLVAASLASFLAAAGGCVVYRGQPTRTTRAVVVKQPACHPSQYWDGNQCRHKGQGSGARKHDGR